MVGGSPKEKLGHGSFLSLHLCKAPRHLILGFLLHLKYLDKMCSFVLSVCVQSMRERCKIVNQWGACP